MAHDADSTKAALLRAGAHWFARDGIDGARISDIVQQAGQSNPSAINYHFGSRWGLLRAIVADQMRDVDAAIAPLGDGLSERVEAIVAPVAGRLRTDIGRDFLRIGNQLADRSAAEDAFPAHYVAGTRLWAEIERLEGALPGKTSKAREDRLMSLLYFLSGNLSWRARQIEAGQISDGDIDAYVHDLVAMLTAAASA